MDSLGLVCLNDAQECIAIQIMSQVWTGDQHLGPGLFVCGRYGIILLSDVIITSSSVE